MSDVDTRRATQRRLATVMLVEAALFVLFWGAWFVDNDLVATDTSPEYQAFEEAFPLPDSLVVVCLVLGAYGLLRDRRWSVCFVMWASGAIVFLGLVDLAYDVQNGMWGWHPDGLGRIAVVTGLLASGLGFGHWGWRQVTEPTRVRARDAALARTGSDES
ncbi:MAG: hypothetical protein ACRD2C_05440 [Acidimicrobiales bacterium]